MNDVKPPWLSFTIWSAFVAALAQVLAMFGIELDMEIINSTLNDVISVIGVLISIWGRFRARSIVTLTGQR